MIKEIKIIYKNEDILVVDKPAGLEVYSEIGRPGPTLIDWLLKEYPRIQGVGPDSKRPGIVHRLDKAASGLLVIAKTNQAYKHLIKQFQAGQIKKEYIVLVHGRVTKESGIIEFPLARTKSGRFAAMPIGAEGREAITEYEVVKRFKNFTLLKVRIKTGRTHQIRVHLHALGHSVVGDKLYKQKRIKKIPLDRLFLHASTLGFYDLKNEWKEFKGDLPIELTNFLKSIE